MLREWRKAVRSIVKRPSLALTVTLTLALGIGATSAVFAAIDAVLLKPLPYPNADRLVAVFETAQGGPQSGGVAGIRLADWARLTKTFDGLAGSHFENVTDTTGAVPERLAAARTSPGFFSVVGTSAAIGRTFIDNEEVFGGSPAVVLSDAVWRTRYNSDPSMVGRSMTLGGVSRTIVGIMPPSFRYPTAETEVWIPQTVPGLMGDRRARLFSAIGRLKPDVTMAQAAQDLAAVQARLGEQFPETDKGWSVRLVPLKEEQIGSVRRSLWFLFGAVVLVLFASCGNIATLLLADAARRDEQVAVQFALGASRGRIIRQRLLEGLALSIAGSVAALLVAYWGINALRALATQLPRAVELQLDARLIGFTLGTAVLATLLFALVPAVHATRRDAAGHIRHGTRGSTAGRHRIHRVLVGVQIAFAIVLLVGAGLLVRSLSRLQDVSPGFDPNGVMAFRMSAALFERPDFVINRQKRTLERLLQIPGVQSVAISTPLPGAAEADSTGNPFGIVGRDTDSQRTALGRQVSSGYFRTMRIPVVQGETCDDDARSDAPTRVLVNQSLATRYFAGENPVGQRIQQRLQAEIVGVVGDARELRTSTEPRPTLYYCGLSGFFSDPWFMIRFDPAQPVALAAIRTAMREVEPQRSVFGARLMNDVLATSRSQPRFNTILLGIFAAIAILLVAIGIYGMVAQYVADRTPEIGLRLALGARPSQVLAQVLGQTAWVTLAGLGGGLVTAMAISRFMTGMLFDVSSTDLLTFVAVPLLLAFVVIVATFVPARRAAGLDPVTALRED